MSDERTSLAKRAFNTAWDLIDLAERDAEQARTLVVRAMASRYLWEEVGGEEQLCFGDWQSAYALSLAGAGDLALSFASAALERAEAAGWTDWRLASCHEGVARACRVLGDRSGFEEHAARCREILEGVEDAEDRELIASQLESIPAF